MTCLNAYIREQSRFGLIARVCWLGLRCESSEADLELIWVRDAKNCRILLQPDADSQTRSDYRARTTRSRNNNRDPVAISETTTEPEQNHRQQQPRQQQPGADNNNNNNPAQTNAGVNNNPAQTNAGVNNNPAQTNAGVTTTQSEQADREATSDNANRPQGNPGGPNRKSRPPASGLTASKLAPDPLSTASNRYIGYRSSPVALYILVGWQSQFDVFVN